KRRRHSSRDRGRADTRGHFSLPEHTIHGGASSLYSSRWDVNSDPTCSYLKMDDRLEQACAMALSPSNNPFQDQMGKSSPTYQLTSRAKAVSHICCRNDTRYPCMDEVKDRGTLSMTSLLRDRQNETKYSINQTCGATPDFYWDCTQLDYPMYELAYVHTNTSDYFYDLSFRNLSQFRLIAQFALPAGLQANKTYAFTGGLSLGHFNPWARSDEKNEKRKSGWRTLRNVLSSQAGIIRLNLSSLPTPNTTLPEFAKGITMDSFMDKVIGAMETKEAVKLWFNNKRWASLRIYTNVLTNALLRLAHLRKNESLESFNQGIVGVNHPMNLTLEDSFDQSAIQKVTLFRVVLLVLVFSVIPAGYAVFLVEERVSHSFHLQLVSGLSRKMYWAMSYLFDMSLYLLCVIIIIVIYVMMGVKDFTYTPPTPRIIPPPLDALRAHRRHSRVHSTAKLQYRRAGLRDDIDWHFLRRNRHYDDCDDAGAADEDGLDSRHDA
ncbi:hypothetical protein PMAYCL1PPCAC_25903, partial [Pristionchus mayeri]